ncbi:aminotransferase, partial [Megasphaera massiliensis]|nr:aminotransferase [Megasphaera massiliensis]
MIDSKGHFNILSFSAAVYEALESQDSLLIILNTPPNNPTGFALSDEERRQVLDVCRFHEKK